MQRKYKTGFTLIEMLVVIGIIAVLMGSTVVGIGKMRKTAQKARTQETVSNAATALTIIFQKEMNWPKLISQNFKSGSYGRLDENVCRAFVKGLYFRLFWFSGLIVSFPSCKVTKYL